MFKERLKKNNLSKGQSLVEILLALSVFALGFTTIGMLVLNAHIFSRDSFTRTQALLLSRGGLEVVRSLRDADFDNLTAGTYGIVASGANWTLSNTPDTKDEFTRTILIEDLDVDTKKITSTVTWETFASVRKVQLAESFTDWAQTQGQGGDLRVDIGGATLAQKNRELQGIKIENITSSAITIDKMKVSWNNNRKIEEIKIDGIVVWSAKGIGSPRGQQPSGTELDIKDFTLPGNSGLLLIDRFRFNGNMAGANFLIKFLMGDGSTTYTFLEL